MATPVPSAVRGAHVESGGPGVLRLPTNHMESLRVRPSFWRQSLKSQGLDRELFLLLHLLVAARVCHSSCLQCDSTSILFATLSGDSLYVCPCSPNLNTRAVLSSRPPRVLDTVIPPET